jgi:hypothetical protein
MNKSIYTTILLIILSMLAAQAQFIHGGFKVGVNASQVSGDKLSGFNKAGIHGGMYAGFSVSQQTRMQIEMLFTQKGSRRNAKPDKGIYSTYIMRLNYIEIPVLMTWKGNSYLEIEGGLSYAQLIKNVDVEFDENGVMPGQNPFRKYEISGMIGMNYLLSENTRINFRAVNSLFPIREHAGGGTYLLNRGQYNSVLMLGFVYHFGN